MQVMESNTFLPPMTTVAKATSKGQITLPVRWRRRCKTDRFLVEEHGVRLTITPLDVERARRRGEYTVFDAIRDHRAKGIRAKDLAKILRSLGDR